MRTMSAALLVLLASAGACRAAVPHRVVHHVVPCGSFEVEATTIIAVPGGGMDGDILSQSVHLTNPATHRTVAIGAPQHLSPDSNIGGRPAIDMPAYEVVCQRLRDGQHVVTLNHTCLNINATTCPPAMDWRPEYGTPGRPNEDYWTYDGDGRLIYNTDPGQATDAQCRHFLALGLFPEYMPKGVDLRW